MNPNQVIINYCLLTFLILVGVYTQNIAAASNAFIALYWCVVATIKSFKS